MIKPVFAAALLAVSSPAHALTLVDLKDAAAFPETNHSYSFVAGASTTTFSFAGYNLPGAYYVRGVSFSSNSAGPNLADDLWDYTPGPGGGFVAPAGTYLLTQLGIGNVVEGSYDTWAQTVATTIGAHYTLKFTLENPLGGKNALRVAVSDATIAAPAPEPAAWAMMMVGFGAIGSVLRAQRRNLRVSFS